ncbi:hypothetical protein FuraDRAFT_1082 [Pseudogulbenkiania ferrooxidans 2002]|uniref:Uncharacterized protein n=1 Tax=Pseudogulbenkiania ferrooxidans 2002 TaxID=279714 RepID=B9Z147_9NEIS|nr:hypothetical protein FuraDRAFT_1082 [Pseudogulbenkiania ferrooxidans 2002]
MPNDVGGKVFADTSVLKHGDQGRAHRMEGVGIGEAKRCLQPPIAFPDGIRSVPVLVEGQAGEEVPISRCGHKFLYEWRNVRMDGNFTMSSLRLCIGDPEGILTDFRDSDGTQFFASRPCVSAKHYQIGQLGIKGGIFASTDAAHPCGFPELYYIFRGIREIRLLAAPIPVSPLTINQARSSCTNNERRQRLPCQHNRHMHGIGCSVEFTIGEFVHGSQRLMC